MDDESRISDVCSIDNSLDTQTGNTKKRKEIQPRSGVWAHFDKVVENGIGRAKCKYCKNPYAANSSKNGITVRVLAAWQSGRVAVLVLQPANYLSNNLAVATSQY
ncbi:hypothetical protein HAX54_050838 [Datura stramonium]|uniref:BED-type domain-containing protein n=1 Tax=Datura stramonium TaxID=4076 RepID=A0ABS8WP84_DATST|nr:hypothetical protein [Datura stramonium]